MTSDDARPVWLTREQRDAIENMVEQFYDLNHVGNVVEQWDAAPADAERAAMDVWDNCAYPHSIITAVLRALGMPA